VVGTAIIVGVFVAGAGLGLYYASLHHGIAPTAVSFEVTVANSHMSQSPLRVREGDQVVLSIAGDRNQTLLLRGYNQRFQLTAGVRVAATFVASQGGTFDFVLEGSGTKVGELVVSS
jgi:hypothetical protein